MEEQTSTGGGVMRAAGLIMIAILISRLLGFVREMAVTRIFGRTEITDAFYAAFNIPDLMYRLLIGGALSAAFIPVFTSYIARGEEEEGWRVASTFINIVVLILLLLTWLGVVFSPKLAPLVAYAFEGEQRELLVFLMRMMFPAVFLTALAGLAKGILESYKYFTSSAFGPVVYNIIIIIAAVLLGPVIGIKGMAIGVVVGALGNLLLQLPFVIKRAKGFRLVIDLKSPGIRRMGRLMIPSIVGLSVAQINLIVNQNLASGLMPGDITALRLANRLMELPVAIFAMSASTVLFPTLTRQIARGEKDEFKRTISQGFRIVFFMMIPAAVGLLTLRTPIIRLLFERGQFTSMDTEQTAYALFFYSLGVIGVAGVQIGLRAFYALHDTVTPLKIGLFTVSINILLSIIFIRYTQLGHGGLALAYAIASTLNSLSLLVILRNKVGGIGGFTILSSFLRALLCASVMGIVVINVAGISEQVYGVATIAGQLYQVGLAIGIGTISYGLCALVFTGPEVRYFFSLIRKRKQ